MSSLEQIYHKQPDVLKKVKSFIEALKRTKFTEVEGGFVSPDGTMRVELGAIRGWVVIKTTSKLGIISTRHHFDDFPVEWEFIAKFLSTISVHSGNSALKW